MSQSLDRDRWFALVAQSRAVPWSSIFLSHFTARIGYTRGATLPDPLAFARHLHIADDDFASIAAFLVREDLVVRNPDASMTLTQRGEEWYGQSTLFEIEMLRGVEAQHWHDFVAGVRDVEGYEAQSRTLNEHQGPTMMEIAQRMATEAVRDHAPEKIRLGLIAASFAIAVANDGTRPQWVPSFADIHAVLVSLVNAAAMIDLDASSEVRKVADIVSGQAQTMLRDVIAR